MGDFKNMLHDEFVSPAFLVSFYTILFLFGISIGSFLNVVILRLPRNESLIKRSSHCMTCGAKIRAVDLIPVFSWLALKGKCHNCGERISPRYPVVESLNGILFVLTFFVLDLNADAITTCVLMSLLVVVGFMDWDTMEIDERVLAIIALLCIPSQVFTDRTTIEERIVGALIISLPFFIIGEVSRIFIRKKYGEDFRAIELGDTLLMIGGGAYLGTKAVIVSALFGIVIAAVVGLINKIISGESKFAFGPFLSIGIAIGALWGNQIAEWYINLLIAPIVQ
ncbi:MAG: prepilin peptidase [Ruminococcus sp.]|nr:prepilin peptidase [Ruminococcus sp.]